MAASLRTKLEAKLKAKEREVLQLESQIAEARAYMRAIQDVIKDLPREDTAARAPKSAIRPNTQIGAAFEILKGAGKPLHIAEILTRMGKDTSAASRRNLTGTLSARVRDEQVFTRTGPNTFGLIEWGDLPKGPPALPNGFGGYQGTIEDIEDEKETA